MHCASRAPSIPRRARLVAVRVHPYAYGPGGTPLIDDPEMRRRTLAALRRASWTTRASSRRPSPAVTVRRRATAPRRRGRARRPDHRRIHPPWARPPRPGRRRRRSDAARLELPGRGSAAGPHVTRGRAGPGRCRLRRPPESRRALALARSIAQRTGARLELLSVVTTSVEMSPDELDESHWMPPLRRQHPGAHRRGGRRARRHRIGACRRRQPCRAAEAALRARRPPRHRLAQLTAARLVRDAACPVMVLPRGAATGDRRARAGRCRGRAASHVAGARGG